MAGKKKASAPKPEAQEVSAVSENKSAPKAKKSEAKYHEDIKSHAKFSKFEGVK